MKLMNIVFFLICFSLNMCGGVEISLEMLKKIESYVAKIDQKSSERVLKQYYQIPFIEKIAKIDLRRSAFKAEKPKQPEFKIFNKKTKKLENLSKNISQFLNKYYKDYIDTHYEKYFLKYTNVLNLTKDKIEQQNIGKYETKNETIKKGKYIIEIFSNQDNKYRVLYIKQSERLSTSFDFIKKIIQNNNQGKNVMRVIVEYFSGTFYEYVEAYNTLKLLASKIVLQEEKGRTILHILIKSGTHLPPFPDFFSKLKIREEDVNIQDKNGNTPLHFSILYDNETTISLEALLKLQNIDLDVENNEGKTALELAVEGNKISKVVHLIKKRQNMQKAFLFVAERDNKEMINLFFDHNFLESNNINVQDEDGNTALHLTKDVEIVKFLLEHGANVNIANDNGFTPLDLSVRRRNKDKVKLLILYGATQKKPNGSTVLHDAITMQNDIKMIKSLINSDSINQKNNLGQTPLYVICARGEIAVPDKIALMREFLYENADPNIKEDEGGRTPLSFAISEDGSRFEHKKTKGSTTYITILHKDYKDIINLLFEYYANPNTQDIRGNTPLHYAILNNNFEIVKLLLEHDADPDISDNNNHTPLYYALKNKHFKIAQLLFSHSKNKNKIIGLFLLALSSIGVGGFFGFRYYKSKQVTNK